MQYLFGFVLSALSLFLILLILVQRGRGGGLTGALGGSGGTSAFGAKAGDTFTKVTSIVTLVWILLCSVALATLQTGGDSKLEDGAAAPITGAELGTAPAADGAADTTPSRFTPGAADAAPGTAEVENEDDMKALDQPTAEAPKTETPAAETPAAEAPKTDEKPAE